MWSKLLTREAWDTLESSPGNKFSKKENNDEITGPYFSFLLADNLQFHMMFWAVQ